MKTGKNILFEIKDLVKNADPDATIILYGSFARGDNKPGSDIDLLILLPQNKITNEDERNVKYPLYDLEFDTGQIISPLVLSASDWENRHKITPLYENIKREGVVL